MVFKIQSHHLLTLLRYSLVIQFNDWYHFNCKRSQTVASGEFEKKSESLFVCFASAWQYFCTENSIQWDIFQPVCQNRTICRFWEQQTIFLNTHIFFRRSNTALFPIPLCVKILLIGLPCMLLDDCKNLCCFCKNNQILKTNCCKTLKIRWE